MSDIKDWSTTAANNNSASPDGFPEGMAPSGVNNSAREVMAAVRTQHEAGGWNDLGHTPTFATTTTFTIATDVTAQYAVNRRIKCTDATTLYGYISASSYGAPNTTVTVVLDSGVLSGSLSAVALSNLSPEAQSRTTGGALSAASATFAGSVDVAGAHLALPTSTTTALADITDAINTAATKVEGVVVFNTTTNKPVYAVGSADGDVWVDATGTTAHTPVTPV